MSICECCDPEGAAARDAALAADPTPPMGLHPAAPGCGCQLCVPPPVGSLDAAEARSVRTVEKYGWQVVSVYGGPGPEFAYTVGLPHRAGHPELLMSGHHPAAFVPCLDELAEQVLGGTVFTGGEVVEEVLPGGQPASWRAPTGRVGMLAADPVWPLTTPPDALAVACRHIVEDGKVPRCVVRHDDGDGGDLWAFQ